MTRWCYGDGVWDEEGAWGTPSEYETTEGYTKGARCGTLAVMVVVLRKRGNGIILILNKRTSPPTMLGKGGGLELTRTADNRDRRAQSMLVIMLRFYQRD
jgi:hypothetical protein